MMGEEKKELKEGEEDLEVRDLKKNFDEQKKILQFLQRDISDLKRSMGTIQNDLAELKNLSDLDQKIARIELGMERTYHVNLCYALGGSFITIGAITMSIGFTVGCHFLNLLGGLFMIVAGIVNLFIAPLKPKFLLVGIVSFIFGLLFWILSIYYTPFFHL